MTTLYNCHTDGDQYRITKFDSFGNVESTYLCTIDECKCPAGFRPSCRHRHMLPRFIAKDAVNSFWFYDYDRQGWVTNEPAVGQILPMEVPEGPAPMNGFENHEQEIDAIAALTEPLPDGIQAYSLNDLSPAQLHNVIAEAVGEPTVPAPP